MDVTTVLRVAFSLAVVMGLLWLSYRVADRSRRQTPGGRGAQLTVVARQGLSQKSAAVLLDSGGTRYLLGVTESSVTVIDQGPAPAAATAAAAAGPKHAVRDATASRLGPFNVVKSAAGPRSAAAPSGGAAVAPVDQGAPADVMDGTDPVPAGGLAGRPTSPSFDEAVLAAQVWLDETPLASVAAPARPGRTVAVTAAAAAPSGVTSAGLDPAAVRSLLAVDTWRQAARAVWGPRR
ncbi:MULTISPECIES: FliO/MopB family protein [Oerskovia]|uniref:FliO/MopB family protein n=1 Tax=Oerskovia rustica TaxID=2762237 RepID=A0ABR8RUB6_9CELL|nr:flagellar biosynthetic protein FliO [Oerskovia rustica]MBD7951384.1 FliO/MopB family protein [Oerskovia rustica]